MTTYSIYLGSTPIACVATNHDAYACFEAAKTIGECVGCNVSLVWDDTGEVIAYEDFTGEEYDDEPADIDDDCGFDPYEGCFTYDC